jgi:hypothetical protein
MALMGLFRPAKTVTSPSGDYWELYVSKTALPTWRGTDADDIALGGSMGSAQLGLAELPLMLLVFLWANVLVPLARVLVLLPVAVVRGRRSRTSGSRRSRTSRGARCFCGRRRTRAPPERAARSFRSETSPEAPGGGRSQRGG